METKKEVTTMMKPLADADALALLERLEGERTTTADGYSAHLYSGEATYILGPFENPIAVAGQLSMRATSGKGLQWRCNAVDEESRTVVATLHAYPNAAVVIRRLVCDEAQYAIYRYGTDDPLTVSDWPKAIALAGHLAEGNPVRWVSVPLDMIETARAALGPGVCVSGVS